MNVIASSVQPLAGKVLSIIAAGPNLTDSGPGGWMPELRGILTVVIGFFVLMGSTYLILGTNMGFRLGFLVAFAGLAGWMFIMGAIWWTYGIGLKGPEGSWDPVPAKTVLQDVPALQRAGVVTTTPPSGDTPRDTADAVTAQMVVDGWKVLPETDPQYGQAASAAEVYLVESGTFSSAAGYRVVNVYDIGGERYPMWADGAIDFIAFWHKPRYSVVEVAPVLPQRVEPGRAPATPRIDESQPHQYVYMVRNLGAKRQPAGFITVGSLIVLLVSAWLLHRRDQRVWVNRGQLALPKRT